MLERVCDTGSAVDFIDRPRSISNQMHHRRGAPIFLHQDFQPVGEDALLGKLTRRMGETRPSEHDCNDETEYGLQYAGKVQR